MENVTQIKKSSNFGTVVKQTILSTFSQPSTWISFGITFAITLLLIVVLPTAIGNKDSISFWLPPMFYPISLMVILQTIVVTTNGLELHEMTFVLSRPINRKNYVIGKFFASLITSCFIFIGSILLMLIHILYCQLTFQVDVLSANNIKWITIFLPIFCAWLLGICSSIFFRTFIKKDAIISVVTVLIVLLTYQLYNIITFVVLSKKPDPTIEYLIIPCVVFGTLAISFFIAGYNIFKRMFVRV